MSNNIFHPFIFVYSPMKNHPLQASHCRPLMQSSVTHLPQIALLPKAPKPHGMQFPHPNHDPPHTIRTAQNCLALPCKAIFHSTTGELNLVCLAFRTFSARKTQTARYFIFPLSFLRENERETPKQNRIHKHQRVFSILLITLNSDDVKTREIYYHIKMCVIIITPRNVQWATNIALELGGVQRRSVCSLQEFNRNRSALEDAQPSRLVCLMVMFVLCVCC